MLEARRGYLLPRAGVPVRPPPPPPPPPLLPVGELGEVIPRGRPCLCKCPDPPLGSKDQEEGGIERRNAPGSKGEDFVPWVPVDREEPQDLEKEERRERMTGLLDRYAARKRKRQVVSSSESDPAPVQTVGPSLPATNGQPVTDGSSGD